MCVFFNYINSNEHQYLCDSLLQLFWIYALEIYYGFDAKIVPGDCNNEFYSTKHVNLRLAMKVLFVVLVSYVS